MSFYFGHVGLYDPWPVGDATKVDPTVLPVADLMRQAAGLYGQWRHGIWESVDEMRRVRTDLPERVFRLVADLIAADEATR